MPPENASSETAPRRGMVDLHTHVLPGIDDGADTLAEAAAMCRRAAAEGAEVVVATPHLRHAAFWNGDRGQLEDLLAQLADELAGEVEVVLGGEVALNSESIEELYALPGGDLPTLAGSRYVLVELDWHGLGPDVSEVVYELGLRGLVPVIAHPERVRWLAGDLDLLESLVERGALLQLTAMSLTGEIGRRTQVLSESLLEAGLVHFVASDAHDLRVRPPGLLRAAAAVAARFGDETVRRLFVDNPRAVVDDRPLADA